MPLFFFSSFFSSATKWKNCAIVPSGHWALNTMTTNCDPMRCLHADHACYLDDAYYYRNIYIACLCFEIGVCPRPDLSFQYTRPTPVLSLHLIPSIQYHPGIPVTLLIGSSFNINEFTKESRESFVQLYKDNHSHQAQ